MKVSKYRQVTDWIQKRIADGELSEGDKLESENDISAAFGISRQTVRHALGLLEQQGVLTRVRGSGTFVKKNTPSAQKPFSKIVTIMTTYADGYIFPRILRVMVEKLEEAGYSARIMFTNNRIETERRLLLRLLDEDGGGPLIAEPVISGLPNANLGYYLELRRRGIPILFFHSFYEGLDIPHISMDDVQAGQAATEYLISCGHKRIASIFKADDGQGRRRYQGYVRALIDAGLEVDERHICWIDTLEKQDFSGIEEKVSERLEGCTACVCYNDEVAHTLTKFLQERRIRIPEDLSLVSIDNSELAKLNTVPLTSVTHPMERLGVRVAEAILRLVKDPDCNVTYEFQTTVEVRDSVASMKPAELVL